MPWDPAQYLKFTGHRLRPAIDLLNRIDVANPAEVYDLGAGAGNVTRGCTLFPFRRLFIVATAGEG